MINETIFVKLTVSLINYAIDVPDAVIEFKINVLPETETEVIDLDLTDPDATDITNENGERTVFQIMSFLEKVTDSELNESDDLEFYFPNLSSSTGQIEVIYKQKKENIPSNWYDMWNQTLIDSLDPVHQKLIHESQNYLLEVLPN